LNVWKYEVRETLEISAPPERVYAIAANPDLVPSYAAEIVRIEKVKRLSEHTVLVRSHLRIWRKTICFQYKYHYQPPRLYSGVQEGRGLLRGYFTLRFTPFESGTIVSHTEGILSRVPFCAPIAGLIYFSILSRGGMKEELRRLKNLVEARGTSFNQTSW